MESANIEKLLEKYLEAETSLQEEQVLQDYFSKDDIAPNLLEYQPLFNYFKESKTEQLTQNISIAPKKNNNWKWLSVAAAAVLVFGVYISTIFSSGKLSVQEEKEARLALAQTQQAFQLLSQNLNKGENVALAGLTELERAQNKVFKSKN